MKHETNSAPPVLDPVRELTIGSEKIQIKELSWPQALKFLQMLAKHSSAFIKDGKFEFDMGKIPDLVINASELSNYLILHASGKEQAWMDKLSFADGCEVLDAALVLNLSPEILGKAKKVAGRFAQAMGVDAAAPTKKLSPPASTS